MTIETNVKAGFDAVSVSVRALRKLVTGANNGDLSTLSTTTKVSIIAAINELQQVLTNSINDADNAALHTTYSASKIETRLAEFKEGILGGASGAYDTLLEIQQFLQGDAAQIASLLQQIGTKVSFTEAQTLTTEQKTTARSNIGAASTVDLTAANGKIAANEGAISALAGRVSTVEAAAASNANLINTAGNYDYAAAYNAALTA